MNTKAQQQLIQQWRMLNLKHSLQTIWWFILTIIIFAFAILIKTDNSFIFTVLGWDFFNNQLNFINYVPSSAALITLQTYLYMAILAAIIAGIGLIFIRVKTIVKKYIEIKYNVVSDLENNFFIFKNLLIVNIAKNITFIFCFTNAITFILVLLYWILSFVTSTIVSDGFHINRAKIKTKLANSDTRSILTILAIEATYFIVQNILSIPAIGINFNQILQYFIPASSLALIIAVFIQSLVKNNVKIVLNNINNIGTKADDFKIFYQLEKQNVLINFSFIQNLPKFIRIKLKNNQESKAEVLLLIEKTYQLIVILEAQKNKNQLKIQEYNYLMYHIFYEVNENVQIDRMTNTFTKKRKKE